MIVALAVVGALGALALVAQAQPADPQTAAAKAQADAIIAAAHAERYFVNVTSSAVPTVRHLQSGMECAFSPGEPGRIEIYDSGGPAGDDVSCGTEVSTALRQRIVVTMYATRYPQPRTIDEDLAAILASIRTHLPDAKPAQGFSNAAMEGAPAHKSIRLEALMDGQPTFTRAAAAVVGPWVIAQRITSDLPAASQADILGEILINTAAVGVAKAQASAAAGAAGR